MMKKSIFTATLFLFGCAGGLFAQDNRFDELDTLSLSDAKELLQRQSEQIEALQQLASLRISIKPATSSNDEDFEALYEVKSPDSLKAIFAQYFSEIELKQHIQMPTHSLLNASANDAEILLIQNGCYPTLQLKKIFFMDGTSKDTDAANDDYEIKFDVAETKPIDSILVSAHYQFPSSVTKVHLDANNTKYSGNGGFIELKSIDGNSIAFLISDTLYKRMAKIQALNRRGKALSNSSSSSATMPSIKEMMSVVEQYNTILKTIIKNIDGNQYKNTAQLKQDLIKQCAGLPRQIFETQETMREASYTFRGSVASVDFFINSPDSTHFDTLVVLKNSSTDGMAKTDWMLAQDENSEKYGFVDAAGNWAVEPTLKSHGNELEKMNNFLYRAYKPDEKESHKDDTIYSAVTYWLDKTNKKWVRENYNHAYAFTLNDSLCQVEGESHGLYSASNFGILNYRTNEIVLPIKFSAFFREGGLVAVCEDEDTVGKITVWGGYTIEGKEIIPMKYEEVETDGTYFYTSWGNWKDIFDKDDVFDRNGRKINPDGTSVIWEVGNGQSFYGEYMGHFENGQPLLVSDTNERHFFIDSTGKKVIDVSKYESVEQFSNGMAIVRDSSGKFGFINMQGQETVPCQYDGVFNFQKNYALVGKNNSVGVTVYYLIDRENKIVKSFGGYLPLWTSINVSRNSNDAHYEFATPSGKKISFNADGEDITNKKESN